MNTKTLLNSKLTVKNYDSLIFNLALLPLLVAFFLMTLDMASAVSSKQATRSISPVEYFIAK